MTGALKNQNIIVKINIKFNFKIILLLNRKVLYLVNERKTNEINDIK